MVTVGGAVGGAICNSVAVEVWVVIWVSSVSVRDTSLLLMNNWILSTVVVDGKAERRWADVAVTPDEESTEKWLSE